MLWRSNLATWHLQMHFWTLILVSGVHMQPVLDAFFLHRDIFCFKILATLAEQAKEQAKRQCGALLVPVVFWERRSIFFPLIIVSMDSHSIQASSDLPKPLTSKDKWWHLCAVYRHPLAFIFVKIFFNVGHLTFGSNLNHGSMSALKSYGTMCKLVHFLIY